MRGLWELIFVILAHFWGPFWKPFWSRFGYHFFDVFLKCLFEGFGFHLGSQNTSKMTPKRGQNPELKFMDFAIIHNTLAIFRGAENLHFSMLFPRPLWGALLEPILMILAHVWVPFGNHVGHFLGTICASIFRPP